MPIARHEERLGHHAGLVGKRDYIGTVGAIAALHLDVETLGIVVHIIFLRPSHIGHLGKGNAREGVGRIDSFLGRAAKELVNLAKVHVARRAVVVQVHTLGAAGSHHPHAASFLLVVGLKANHGIVEVEIRTACHVLESKSPREAAVETNLVAEVRLHDSGLINIHLRGDAKHHVVAVEVVATAVVLHAHPHRIGTVFDETAKVAVGIYQVQVFRRKTRALEVGAGRVRLHALRNEAVVLLGRGKHFPTVVETNVHALWHIYRKGCAAHGRNIAVRAARISLNDRHDIVGVVAPTGHSGRRAVIEVVHIEIGIIPLPYLQTVAGGGGGIYLILHLGKVVDIIVNLCLGEVNVLDIVVSARRVIVIAKNVRG